MCMPKLPAVTPKRFEKMVLKLGFWLSHTRGSHRYYVHSDKRIVCIAMHSRDIPKGTLFAMIKDLKLSNQEFVEWLKKV